MRGHLEITTKIGCKMRCKFCPQKTLVTNYEDKSNILFRLEDFYKVVSTVPTSIDIHFSGFAEPFLNPDVPEMLKHACEKGHKVVIYSTLVGLDERGVEALRNYPPRYMCIHITDGKAMRIDADKWIAYHDLFLKTGIRAEYMAMGAVTETVDNYLKSKGIQYNLPKMLSRGGNLGLGDYYIEGPLYCSMNRWHQNVVLPNGNVYLCCMDYGLTAPLGNLLVENYQAIWNKAESYRNDKNPPDDSICRKCEWAGRA